jgi:hypothetical protein
MQNRLDLYLMQVDERLGTLPVWRRVEEIEEVRQHLQALVDAYIELGQSEEEALTAALAQFGSAPATARGLRRAWRRQTTLRDVRPCIERAFNGFGRLGTAHVAASLLLGCRVTEPVSLEGLPMLLLILGSAASLLAGWEVGKEAPGRGWIKALSACASIFVTVQVLTLGVMLPGFWALLTSPTWVELAVQILHNWFGFGWLVALPSACVAATAASAVEEWRRAERAST